MNKADDFRVQDTAYDSPLSNSLRIAASSLPIQSMFGILKKTSFVLENSPEELALVTRAKQGDLDAFALLCEPLREDACKYLVASGLASETDAEDVFSDALLKALRSLDRFRGQSSFKTWFYTIMRTRSLDLRRAQKSHPTVSFFQFDGDAGEEISGEISPSRITPIDPRAHTDGSDAELLRKERVRCVRETLARMPERIRSVLILYYENEFSYAEIAQMLRIPIGTVMSRLHNGRKKLESLLSDFRPDP